MTFALNDAGTGCYSLMFKGEHIGAVFSCEEAPEQRWIAVIHDGGQGANRCCRPHSWNKSIGFARSRMSGTG